MKLHYPLIPLAISTALATQTQAANISVTVAIPQLKVAEYHRPYTALWIETAEQEFAANLAVWYDVKMQNHKGHEWLKDIRQWWRKSGRELQLPIDGLSSATRAPGEHQLDFNDSKAPLKDLPVGNYRLVVEAAREVGGRELLAIPFQWPIKSAQSLKAPGQHELGAIALELKP